MTEKVFYSLVRRKNVTGAVKQHGFEIKQGEFRVFVYQDESAVWYVIDPDTGLDLLRRYDFQLAGSMEEHILPRAKKIMQMAKKQPGYPMRVGIFKKYREAAVMEEIYKQMERNEVERKLSDKEGLT